MAENTGEKKRSATSAKQATVRKKPVPAKAAVAPTVGKKDENKKKAAGKVNVIRGFGMPQAEYEKFVELKQLCLKAGVPVKKKELLRAGLHALGSLSVPKLKQVLSQVVQVKGGRPRQGNAKSALSE